MLERRSDRPDVKASSDPRAGTAVDPRISLALWLRAGRVQRGMTLEDVSRVTKIQARTLERLESGKPDGLPADVFVRGFVRSFAKCVGLDEDEALRRYGACGVASAPAVTARAMVEAMADLAPSAARAIPAARAPLASGSLQDLPRADVMAEMAAAPLILVDAAPMAPVMLVDAEAAAPIPAEAAALDPAEAAAPIPAEAIPAATDAAALVSPAVEAAAPIPAAAIPAAADAAAPASPALEVSTLAPVAPVLPEAAAAASTEAAPAECSCAGCAGQEEAYAEGRGAALALALAAPPRDHHGGAQGARSAQGARDRHAGRGLARRRGSCRGAGELGARCCTDGLERGGRDHERSPGCRAGRERHARRDGERGSRDRRRGCGCGDGDRAA